MLNQLKELYLAELDYQFEQRAIMKYYDGSAYVTRGRMYRNDPVIRYRIEASARLCQKLHDLIEQEYQNCAYDRFLGQPVLNNESLPDRRVWDFLC